MNIMQNESIDHSIKYFNPSVNRRQETHLDFMVMFENASGRCSWVTGTLAWGYYSNPDDLKNEILSLQTKFVRQQWTRIEVSIPNRDAYGNLQSGLVKPIGLMLASRALN